MSSKGLHWYNNGKEEVNSRECPQGFVAGRLKPSSETRAKMKESSWTHKATKEELQKRNNKISKTIQSRTEEEKREYSKKISTTRKGKGLGKTPWSKGKHLKAWNVGIPMSEEQKEKLRQTYKNLPQEEKRRRSALIGSVHKGKMPWNKGLSYCLKPNVVKAMKELENETKRRNGSYLRTKVEERVYDALSEYFDSRLIDRQHHDERYPFDCDFYLPSLDIYVEINGNWTHGWKPFDKGDAKCLEQLNKWEKKAQSSDYYKNAIYTWTDLDMRKRSIAKNNHLRYISIYPNKSLEENIGYCYNNGLDEDIFYPLVALIHQATQFED